MDTKYIISCIVLFTLVACGKDKISKPLAKNSYVEFIHKSNSHTIPYTANFPYAIYLPIQYFGKTIDAPQSLSIKISSHTLSETFDFMYDSLHVISPNSIFDSVKVTIISPSIIEGNSYSFTCTIQPLDAGIVVLKEAATTTISFTKESLVHYFSGSFSCFEDATSSTYNTEFVKLSDTVVANTNFWDFPLSGQVVPYIFRKDSLHSVIIPPTPWADKLQHEYIVEGEGQYSISTKSFFVNYRITDNKGNIEQVGTHSFK